MFFFVEIAAQKMTDAENGKSLNIQNTLDPAVVCHNYEIKSFVIILQCKDVCILLLIFLQNNN